MTLHVCITLIRTKQSLFTKMICNTSKLAQKVCNVTYIYFRYHCFGYVWFYENVGDEGLFFKKFRQRLIDCSIQDWLSKLNDSGKARHYKYVMPIFGLACCIMYDIPLKFRIALSKLRCSNHNLLVETGRHSNIACENRIRKLCNLMAKY